MRVYAIKGDYLKQCSYLLYFGESSILIDCGISYDELQGFLTDNSIQTAIKGIFITHCHFDHTFGVKELRERGIIKVYASQYTPEMLKKRYDLSRFAYQISNVKIPFERFEVDVLIDCDKEIDLGFCKVKAIYTPGHSLDGMCYFINGILFSGDLICTLDGFGRYDFVTGDMEQLRSSLRKIYNTFDGDTRLLTGHDYSNFKYKECSLTATLKETYSSIRDFAFYDD